MYIDEKLYISKVHDTLQKHKECATDSAIKNDLSDILHEVGTNILDNKDIEYAGTFVLDKFLLLQTEFNQMSDDKTILKKGRIISVNPGSDNIGREQRYIHFYVVLAEHENMFIGVPITNMAYDSSRDTYVLRNPFEVELKNPSNDFGDKPFYQYWCRKPSVADIRNISGLDKRRILKNNLYYNAKFAPDEYLIAIRSKIKSLFNIP